MRRRLDLIFLIALSFGLYANSILGKLIWDDTGLVKAYPEWIFAFTKHFMSPNFYRPIPGLSFYINSVHFGEAPAGYHLTNILLHVAATILLYLLALKLTSRKSLALLAAMIFAVLPAHVEAVAWISGRTDLFCAVFFIAALLAHVNYRETGRGWCLAVAAAAFFLALLSKEAALLFPVAILAYEWMYGLLKKHPVRPWLGAYAVSLATYGILRFMALKVWNPVLPNEIEKTFEPAGAIERLFGLPINIVTYLKISLLPHDPVPFYSAATSTSFFRADVLLSLLVVLIGIAAVFYLRSRRPAAALGLVLFGLTIVPACNLVQLPGTTMAERFTYLPSAGLAIALASLFTAAFEWWPNRLAILKTAVVLLGTIAFITCSGYLTVRGNLTWRDEFAVWEKAASKTTDVPFIHRNLGRAYLERGLPDMAEEEFLTTIELDPGYAAPYEDLGLIYRNRGELEKAVKHLETAVSLEPRLYTAWNNLGATYGMLERYDDAERVLKQALEIVPEYVAARTNLARAYQESGRFAEAAREYEKALELQPELGDANLELGRCYKKAGMTKDARRVLSLLASETANLDLRLAAEEELAGLD